MKLNAMTPADVRFRDKFQVSFLGWSQQRGYIRDTVSRPSLNLLFKPISTAWPRRDRQPAIAFVFDPIRTCVHRN